MEGVTGNTNGLAGSREIYAGTQAVSYRRDHQEIVPTLEGGVYNDWELVEAIWHHAFSDRLRLDMKEHPVMMAEANFQPRKAREKAVELLFEKFQPPALFLAKNAVLSSFASGRQTSMVVDMGYEGSVVTAVADGFVLQNSVVRSPLGGRLLSQCMAQSVQGKGVVIRPSYSIKRFEISPGQYEAQSLDLPHTSDSFNAWHVEQIAADIKESICRVSDTTFDAEANANIPTVDYELPDGTIIQLGPDRFNVPEILFQQNLVKSFAGVEATLPVTESLQASVVKSIELCDVDLRKELYGGIVATGGTSLLPQLRERLEKEVNDSSPQAAKVKVIVPVNPIERRFSVWIGGSILASLGSFQQMWMSKAEFEEHGASLIHRRAP